MCSRHTSLSQNTQTKEETGINTNTTLKKVHFYSSLLTITTLLYKLTHTHTRTRTNNNSLYSIIQQVKLTICHLSFFLF